MPLRRAAAALLWAAHLCFFSSLSAVAGDDAVPGACCSDLTDRIADLEASTIHRASAVSLAISGLITVPMIGWADGQDSDVYLTSNEVRRSRLRFAGEGRIDADWSAGFVAEIGGAPRPFAPMDQLSYDASSGTQEVRLFNWSLKSKSLGQLTVGQLSEASDGITEVSLANTGGVVTTGLPIMLGYFERGFLLRRPDGQLSDVRYGDVLFRGRSSAWGDGHRFTAVRYDTPAFHGITLGATWGEDDFVDAAMRYSGAWGRLHFAAGLAATHWHDESSSNPSGCALNAQNRTDCWQLGGSLSLMDSETGLFANFAAGHDWDSRLADLYPDAQSLENGETFLYAVAGLERQWFDVGKTTLFAQVWHKWLGAGVAYTGRTLDATSLAGLPFVAGGEATVFGISAVQSLADGVEIYASLNRTIGEIRTSATGGSAEAQNTRLTPFDFVVAGMAIRF